MTLNFHWRLARTVHVVTTMPPQEMPDLDRTSWVSQNPWVSNPGIYGTIF